jgi:hypothetical protein
LPAVADKIYLHGFSWSDFLPCWNMHLAGSLSSSDFVVQQHPQQFIGTRSVRDVPLEALRSGDVAVGLCPTPRLTGVLLAAPWRGLETRTVDQDRALRLADLELTFEEERRRTRPDAASRLSSLWLADDNSAGWNFVSRLKGVDGLCASGPNRLSHPGHLG